MKLSSYTYILSFAEGEGEVISSLLAHLYTICSDDEVLCLDLLSVLAGSAVRSLRCSLGFAPSGSVFAGLQHLY